MHRKFVTEQNHWQTEIRSILKVQIENTLKAEIDKCTEKMDTEIGNMKTEISHFEQEIDRLIDLAERQSLSDAHRTLSTFEHRLQSL